MSKLQLQRHGRRGWGLEHPAQQKRITLEASGQWTASGSTSAGEARGDARAGRLREVCRGLALYV